DGIRDFHVTGVQTCALPISPQEALDDVRSAVSQVRGDLPAELTDPIVRKVDLAASPVLAFAVYSDKMDEEALSWFVDNDIAKLRSEEHTSELQSRENLVCRL